MFNKFILTIIFLSASILSFAQTYEDEISFQYVKAQYLVDTERWDDAIKILNDIIKKDENYENSLLLRSEAKFMLAAYEGAKKDVLSYFGSKGIDGESTGLYGRILYALDKKDAALSTLSSAILIDPMNPKYHELRADIYAANGKLVSACEDWNLAFEKGSSKASYNLDKYCGGTPKPVINKVPVKVDRSDVVKVDDDPIIENDPVYEDEQTNDDKNNTDDKSNSNSTEPTKIDPTEDNVVTRGDNEFDDDIAEQEDISDEFDNTENTIVIDEDLTLKIYGRGLGTRKILDRPSILILSDVDGEVAVEVCINERGKVESAEFDPKLSSIDKKSLVSLAIRKSKDFWFEKSDKREQCGFIVFRIKAS